MMTAAISSCAEKNNLNLLDSSDDEFSKLVSGEGKRVQRLSDSDSDVQDSNKNVSIPNDNSDSDDDSNIVRNNSKQSRILPKSDTDSQSESSEPVCKSNLSNINMYQEQKIRVSNKRNRLKDKFKGLLSSRDKDGLSSSYDKDSNVIDAKEESSSSENEEMASIELIKKKIKERTKMIKMSICSPDTSDEEGSHRSVQISKKQPKPKQTKPTSPKPLRMSAKMAMENMQKIKSESNRMLREKEVSLPYHRPKALSLKDIMNRRRPAVSSDGKALPIKMNEEQLKQYSLQLEQRQKEMMELCKSDTDEDEPEGTQNEAPSNLNENTEYTDSMTYTNVENTEEMIPISSVPFGVNDINSEDLNTIPQSTESNIIPSENYSEIEKSAVKDFDLGEVEDSQDHSKNNSADMELVYNDSMEKETECKNDPKESSEIVNESSSNTYVGKTDHFCRKLIKNTDEMDQPNGNILTKTDNCTEKDSQLISLQYDTEINDFSNGENVKPCLDNTEEVECSKFSDNDDDIDMDSINIDDIDKIIENAEILNGTNSESTLNMKPKLTGAPGMVIDLCSNDTKESGKLSGVELLKQRFTYFSKLKTPEELEREKDKRHKPGMQHANLRQKLEEQIAEQRSLEWAKRLDAKKNESHPVGDENSDSENDIDKMESKLEEEENDKKGEYSSESEEEDLVEDDVILEDKPRKKNSLLEDEADESDVEETEHKDCDEPENIAEEDEIESDESSIEDSDSEEEQETKPKKGRILKAFEDSDDEQIESKREILLKDKVKSTEPENLNKKRFAPPDSDLININKESQVTKNVLKSNNAIPESQDDDLQLAQVPKPASEDLFASQASTEKSVDKVNLSQNTSPCTDEVDLGSQTFSIMNTNGTLLSNIELESESSDKFKVISETQPFDDNLDAVVGMCSGSFSQNYIDLEPPSQSQAIGEDILAMCTGKFYENEFVSQPDDVPSTSAGLTEPCNTKKGLSEDNDASKREADTINNTSNKADINTIHQSTSNPSKENKQDDLLKSVLDELKAPEFETSNPLKYFFDGQNQNKENEKNISNIQLKKKFVIESDDDNDDESKVQKKKKKLKKRKPEMRALQISDDEDDYTDAESDEVLSENGDLNEEEKLIEYDSEENEVEIKAVTTKKKRKANEFFDQEAELTSEDEWMGSGDEDEAGLDTMEREEGDADIFHQGQLQRELGQIHMRDVLDQDKREVRLLQELLFEDGDLGDGGRQRKFRWANAGGEEETGTVPDEFADTQEEEFESEEQWRKQRHEREMFLKQLKGKKDEVEEENPVLNVSRSSIIKANINKRTMSNLLEEEANKKKLVAPVPEKITKDIPSPKKGFPLLQQSIRGSLLSRGGGSLARLAAIAGVEEDTGVALSAPSTKRNFVFAALTPESDKTKKHKRKAEENVGTPRLVKKMKTEDKRKQPRSSLLDHMKVLK